MVSSRQLNESIARFDPIFWICTKASDINKRDRESIGEALESLVVILV